MIEKEFQSQTYDFDLSNELIAQEPLRQRDASKLLIIDRAKKSIEERLFSDVVDYLDQGDVLVINNTKVLKARIFAKRKSGGKIELLLLKEVGHNKWESLANPARRVRIGDILNFDHQDITAKVIDTTEQGSRILEFSTDIKDKLQLLGKVPLPPYIKDEIDDSNKYQTVFASRDGAVAAPTAGLHFTEKLLAKVKEKGVNVVTVTLHCGLATFRPVKTEDIRNHPMEAEWIEVGQEVCDAVNTAKTLGKRVVACGTTSIRSLETAARKTDQGYRLKPFSGDTNLYIYPGCEFKIVDSIITNFHTPRSTNLILIATFTGRDLLMQAYSLAASKNYRFYSFGDATMIL